MLEQPQPTDEPIKPPNLRTLKNGAIYDMDKKRIVSSKDVTTKITTDNAVLYQSQRLERKREVARAAANEAVERDDWKVAYGDMAYIAAITETAMRKATTADDPKAIDAARFALQVTGMEEAKIAPAQADAIPATVAGELLSLLRDVMRDKGMVIDADVTDGGG